jgi:hypothetical protein
VGIKVNILLVGDLDGDTDGFLEEGRSDDGFWVDGEALIEGRRDNANDGFLVGNSDGDDVTGALLRTGANDGRVVPGTFGGNVE